MKLQSDQNGIIHLPVIAVIILVGVVAFTAGVAYRVQTNRSNIEIASADESELREITEVDIEEIIAVLPEERKQGEEEKKEEQEKPVEKPPAQKPQQKLVDPNEKPKDKQYVGPEIVKISNVTIKKNGANYILTATLPQSYSGTCQGLLKPEAGGDSKDHITISKSFSGPVCSVEVTEAKLDGFSIWRTYMSFYSSDKKVKSHWTQADNISL